MSAPASEQLGSWRLGPMDQIPDEAHVVCPLHNHVFRLTDGQCTTGERSVQAYQVAVEDGEVVLRLSGKAAVTTIA